MPDDLVDRLWSQALREGVGVTGVGQRMAQLVAEECAKVCDDLHGNAYHDSAADCAKVIRAEFQPPPPAINRRFDLG